MAGVVGGILALVLILALVASNVSSNQPAGNNGQEVAQAPAPPPNDTGNVPRVTQLPAGNGDTPGGPATNGTSAGNGSGNRGNQSQAGNRNEVDPDDELFRPIPGVNRPVPPAANNEPIIINGNRSPGNGNSGTETVDPRHLPDRPEPGEEQEGDHPRVRVRAADFRIADGDTAKYLGREPIVIRHADGTTDTIASQADIRFLGADTPEIAHPGLFDGDQEPYATQAKEYTERLFREAEVLEIAVGGTDRYGRVLAHFFADGESVSLRLVREGLAYETISRYGTNGFVALSRAIREAAANAHPEFEDPGDWRPAHSR